MKVNQERQPRERLAKRCGRCSDCRSTVEHGTPVYRVNGRNVCHCCARQYSWCELRQVWIWKNS